MPLYRHFSGSFAYYGVKNGIITNAYSFSMNQIQDGITRLHANKKTSPKEALRKEALPSAFFLHQQARDLASRDFNTSITGKA